MGQFFSIARLGLSFKAEKDVAAFCGKLNSPRRAVSSRGEGKGVEPVRSRRAVAGSSHPGGTAEKALAEADVL